MKLKFRIGSSISLRKLAAVFALFLFAVSAAHADPVTGQWINATGQGDGPIMNANTASPTVGDGSTNSASGEMFHSPFAAITLANSGDKAIFTGSVTLSGTVGTASGPRTQFRFGLFKDDGDGDHLEWVGYYMSNSSGTGTPSGVLTRKPVGNTSVYLSVTGQSTAFASTMGNGVNFTDDTYTMNLTIERSGNDLLLSGTLSGATNGFTQSLSGTDTTASTLGTYSFDRLGFLAGGNLAADQAQFSNLDVTLVPEPATWALGLAGLVVALIVRHRRSNRESSDQEPCRPKGILIAVRLQGNDRPVEFLCNEKIDGRGATSIS